MKKYNKLTHAKFTNAKIEKMNTKQVNANIAKLQRAVGSRLSAAYNQIEKGNTDMQRGFTKLGDAQVYANMLIKKHQKTAALKVLSRAYFDPWSSTKTLGKAKEARLRSNKKFLSNLGFKTRSLNYDQAEALSAIVEELLAGDYYYKDVVDTIGDTSELKDFLDKHADENGDQLIQSFIDAFNLQEAY